MVRVHSKEAYELISACLLYTIKTYGPDRLAGFTPIPAMSMVSFGAGVRFLSLLGGECLSFYDWYADLPPASPQVWGEQTDVPEAADWYNSDYIIMWGSNIPLTRTPDAHFMTEARYKGTKVVAVSPDYAENVKFADDWLAPEPGSDSAVAQGMTYVILNDFYHKRQVPAFTNYVKQFTDLPFLVELVPSAAGNGHLTSGHYLRQSDLQAGDDYGEWKPLVLDQKTNRLVSPAGTLGHKYAHDQHFNLELKDLDGKPIDPALSVLTADSAQVVVDFPTFSNEGNAVVSRHLPVKTVTFADGSSHQVATIFDLLMAQYGIKRVADDVLAANDENDATSEDGGRGDSAAEGPDYD